MLDCDVNSFYPDIMESNKDIHFLFDTKKWNNKKISDMSNSHIINTLLMLRRKAMNYKINYELFIIDNINNKLLVPKDNIDDIANTNPLDWITTTPLYISLEDELRERNLYNYFITITNRCNENNVEDTK